MTERAVPEADVEEITGAAVAPPWITILHNCDCHTFEQVVKQLQKAIACSEAEGWEIAWQVHNTGKAVVKIGAEPECVRVGNILRAIGLVGPVAQPGPPAESNAHRATLRRDLSAMSKALRAPLPQEGRSRAVAEPCVRLPVSLPVLRPSLPGVAARPP